jgi:hypothetical protein
MTDLKQALQETSSNKNMHKAQKIPGMPSQIVWWKMSVVLGGEQIGLSCLRENVENLVNTLRTSDLFQEGATYITQEDPSTPSITVTFSVRKRIQGKNGVA